MIIKWGKFASLLFRFFFCIPVLSETSPLTVGKAFLTSGASGLLKGKSENSFRPLADFRTDKL